MLQFLCDKYFRIETMNFVWSNYVLRINLIISVVYLRQEIRIMSTKKKTKKVSILTKKSDSKTPQNQ